MMVGRCKVMHGEGQAVGRKRQVGKSGHSKRPSRQYLSVECVEQRGRTRVAHLFEQSTLGRVRAVRDSVSAQPAPGQHPEPETRKGGTFDDTRRTDGEGRRYGGSVETGHRTEGGEGGRAKSQGAGEDARPRMRARLLLLSILPWRRDQRCAASRPEGISCLACRACCNFAPPRTATRSCLRHGRLPQMTPVRCACPRHRRVQSTSLASAIDIHRAARCTAVMISALREASLGQCM
ncbi:hypothetical protein BD413DRAFT_45573 [Trametes elegans]|nr:hypothetical protein BD413DRAFT_45573 [Trametes elegans]